MPYSRCFDRPPSKETSGSRFANSHAANTYLTLDYTPESSLHFHSQETSDEQGPLAGTGEPDSARSLARLIIGFQRPLSDKRYRFLSRSALEDRNGEE